MTNRLQVRNATPDDARRICEIYNYYVLNSGATFEEQPVSEPEMRVRMEEYQRQYAWLVAEKDGQVLGYCYATRWKPRSAYRMTVESAVYVDIERQREGAGALLLVSLVQRLRELGLHCALAGICLPNPASVALHEALGYRKVGELEEVGFKFGRWMNVGYWELVL